MRFTGCKDVCSPAENAGSTSAVAERAVCVHDHGDMMTLLSTTDALKVTAVDAILRGAGIECEVFDGAAGSLWSAIIPIRVMVDDTDHSRACRALRDAGFVQAGDGEWDLTQPAQT